MSDAKRFTEDTGKFGGGTGRSGIQGEHGNVQKEGGGEIQEDSEWEMQRDLKEIPGDLMEIQ
jgi:hypothetical protein